MSGPNAFSMRSAISGVSASLTAEKVGERGAAHFQNLSCFRDVESDGFNDFGFDQVARMRRILHGHSRVSLAVFVSLPLSGESSLSPFTNLAPNVSVAKAVKIALWGISLTCTMYGFTVHVSAPSLYRTSAFPLRRINSARLKAIAAANNKGQSRMEDGSDRPPVSKTCAGDGLNRPPV